MSNSEQLVSSFMLMMMPTPLVLPDGWIARSALQKAIRRGEIDLAGRAARALWQTDRAVAWKLLLGIAFEDVGVGSVDAVIATAMACSAKWRKVVGGDAAVAVAVARMLASAPKNRGTDHLGTAAAGHPDLADFRTLLRTLAIPHVLGMVKDTSLPLVERATAAWNASGVDLWPNRRVGPGDLPALLATYRDLGAPDAVLQATAMALRKVREPIIVMFPLMVMAAKQGGIVDKPLAAISMAGDVPLCALDVFTRLGKTAIAQFATTTPSICAALNDLLPYRLWAKATGFAVFYAEGGLINHRLEWPGGDAIERLCIEAELLPIGFPAACITDFISLVQTELPRLNAIRMDLLAMATVGGGHPLYHNRSAS